MATGRSIIKAMNDFDLAKPRGLRVQSVLSSLLIGLCALGWIGLIVLGVYVPIYTMATGGEGVGESLWARFGGWLAAGGWRFAVPVLLIVSIGAFVWRIVTVVRLYRAARRHSVDVSPAPRRL